MMRAWYLLFPVMAMLALLALPPSAQATADGPERGRCKQTLLGFTRDGRSYVVHDRCTTQMGCRITLVNLQNGSQRTIVNGMKCPVRTRKALRHPAVRRLGITRKGIRRGKRRGRVRVRAYRRGKRYRFLLRKRGRWVRLGGGALMSRKSPWKLLAVYWGPRGRAVLFKVRFFGRGGGPLGAMFTTYHGFLVTR